ncbi:MAG TPA: parallel beta-helix domain-containing protein [Chitinophagales bacterium]|nr:parallel beta-helix domain-containing protein [Chitinophagales bacterium]
MRHSYYNILLIAFSFILFTACKKDTKDIIKDPDYDTHLKFIPGEETKIIEALLTIKNKTWIELAEGKYSFENLSIVGVDMIKFTGAGKDKTILDFSNQSSGGEGILITDISNFIISGMKIMDSEGDLLKVRKGYNVIINNIAAVWSKEGDSTNGGYGLYPVLCDGIVIDSCYVEGASDAGIYVGQSNDAVIKNSKAYKNVAGCEVENTTNAEVYNNEFYGNTGGLLIFDLPGLSKKGGKIKVYNNYIHDNNYKNFAPSASFGTSTGVGNCPPGSGILHVATSDVEIFNNRIINNNTASIFVVSGLILDENAIDKIGDNYDPFPKNISIHDNEMSKKPNFPEAAYNHEFGKKLILIHTYLHSTDSEMHPYLQQIVIDGMNTNLITGGVKTNPDNLCIKESEPNLFLNSDFGNLSTDEWNPSTDIASYICP